MRLSRAALTPRQLMNARKAATSRAQERRLQSRCVSERVSTFPTRLEALRDRLCAENPTLSVESIENMLFTIIHEYPWWYGGTPDADSKAHDLKRDHDITHGFIKAAPLTERQKAAIATRKQERIEREQRITARASASLVQAAS